MRLADMQDILEAELAWNLECAELEEREVGSCHASDLISDMLSFRGPDSLLLTGLTNVQVIRTAEILDFVAICFVRGKRPPPNTIALAEKEGIPLFVAPLSMYESCARLAAKGLPAGASKKVIADWQTER